MQKENIKFRCIKSQITDLKEKTNKKEKKTVEYQNFQISDIIFNFYKLLIFRTMNWNSVNIWTELFPASNSAFVGSEIKLSFYSVSQPYLFELNKVNLI